MSSSATNPIGRVASLLVGLAIVSIGVVVPPPEGLSVEGFRAILLLAGAVMLWMTQPIDLAVTALLGMAAIPVLGIVEPRESFALFGNQAVFFVMGVFVLAAVLMHTGLATRAALTLLARFDRSPSRLAAAVLVLSILFCSVLVSHAVAAILFPIVLEVCRSLELPHGRSPFARRLMLSMAWGTIIGSNLTFLSSVRLGLALGLLHQHDAALGNGGGISFLFWMATSVVVASLMFVAVALVLHWYHPSGDIDMAPAIALLRGKVDEMGPLRADEWVAIASMLAMVGGMVMFGQQLGFGTIAILAAGINFIFGSSTFESVEKYVSWGIVFMFGGAVAMASAVEMTGGIAWISDHLLPGRTVPPLVLIGVVAYLCILMTEFMSNSAVIAALLPICLVLGPEVGLPARAMVFVTVIATGSAFMLPTGTPAMAMVFSSGYLRSRDTVWPGLVLMHLGWLVLMLVAWLWWPILGLR